MAVHPLDYYGIRVWHLATGTNRDWRTLQQRAASEGAPLDTLCLDGDAGWVRPCDLPADHPIHQALVQDRERCRRGFEPLPGVRDRRRREG